MSIMGTSWIDDDFTSKIYDAVRYADNDKGFDLRMRKSENREIIRVPVFKEVAKPKVKKVIINNPAVIIYWNDGTKTVVKCGKEDTFDAEKGFAIAMCKKLYGNTEFGKELAKINKENE